MPRDRRALAHVLDTLARVHGRQVDDERRRLLAVQTTIYRLAADDVRLTQSLTDEAACARAQPDIAGLTYAAFATATASRRDAIAAARGEAVTTADGVRAAMMEAFADQKQLEEAVSAIRRRETAELERYERVVSDEHAIVRYRRLSDDEKG